MTIKSPFPWFGGKSRIAAEIWARLGDPDNYVEPFFGSGAVLMSRPSKPRTESVNDKDRFVANFWRATQHDPETVVAWMDWPVNEVDLTARHLWLLTTGAERIARCDGDPAFYDAQTAGWWCWGACSWIGDGWCSGKGPWTWDDGCWAKREAGQGIKRKRPHLWNDIGINKAIPLMPWIQEIADRLRRVRVCSGDWSRVCGDFVTSRHGMTGMFLDPPYADTSGRMAGLYAQDSLTVAHDAREWAIEAGRNPLMRIAFAGYDGEHVFPIDWTVWRWKAQGGYANQGDGIGRDNAARETIWFSPACLSADQADLFAPVAEDPIEARIMDTFPSMDVGK